MDSLTQAVLGASVGYAVGGPQLGRKAALWGLGLGTLPDLDVFIPFEAPVADFTYHRSATHSLIMQALATPLLAWVITKVHRGRDLSFAMVSLMVFLTLSTHALLDSFTSYGTQLLWPLMEWPFATASISIVDPVYTLPLLLATLGALLFGFSQKNRRFNQAMMIISSLYLGSTLITQAVMTQRIGDTLLAQGHKPDSLFVTPTLANSLAWNYVAKEGDTLHMGVRSLLDDEDIPLESMEVPANAHLLDTLEDDWDTQRLKWFSKGFYQVENHNGLLVINDLRMGQFPFLVFRFALGEMQSDGSVKAFDNALYYRGPRSSREVLLTWILGRITDPTLGNIPFALAAANREE